MNVDGRSKVTLPDAGAEHSTILAFLIARFPRVPARVWEKRFVEGKVLDRHDRAISADKAYAAGETITYCREVESEPVIPFDEVIIFQNEEILVACKPHFLPVNPTGPYVSECLMNRLRRRTGNEDLVPINRIDRETAGIVLFSANRKTRDAYYELFRRGEVEKTYEAVAEVDAFPDGSEWHVENRIVAGEPWFRMKVVPGEANSRSIIKLVEVKGNSGRFQLHPLTGKTHQLRLHMSGLGFGILNERYYPHLQPQTADDFQKPLQLLARKMRFRDPISGKELEFVSGRDLSHPHILS